MPFKTYGVVDMRDTYLTHIQPGPHDAVLVFSLEEQKFGIDIAVVERVVRAVEVTPLPSVPKLVLGLINVQGRVIPVVDFRTRMNRETREIRVSDSFILAHAPSRVLALLVDAVLGVVSRDRISVRPASEVLSNLDSFDGIATLDDSIVLIQNMENLISGDEESALEAALASRGGAA